MTVRLHRSNVLHYASLARSVTILAILLSAIPQATNAQTRPTQKTELDRLGLTCAQILAMTSTDWVTHFNNQIDAKPGNEKKTSPVVTVRGLSMYGQCYDARTNRLAAMLAKNGKGPSMGARKDFRVFEQALEDFTVKALAATDPPADDVKKAYAALYEKQFRYSCYENYVEHLSHGDFLSATAEDAGDMGKAKNHFGELLDALSEDKLREVHKAFARILDQAAFGRDMRLQVYLYAIFCLEPPSAAPFSPPPF
ncbi:MAG TPA: hypothetical protein VLH78_00095 [Candidatus Nanoarchaeia archaeon]|nr:hypothetical protein [Candidatus Nanoarchaeia archaeon]